MSSIAVRVVALDDVRPHENADALDLATIGGWQVVIPRGRYATGDPVVYFEAGTVLSPEWAEQFGVTKYLSQKTNINGEKVLVVHRAKLRGEPSFGLVVSPEDGMVIGQDVTDHYGAVKYQPPVKATAGDSDTDHPHFPAYTDIENLRSFADVFEAGELVVATEKLHGTNDRVGFVIEGGVPVLMAGSRTLRRKAPADMAHSPTSAATNTYWFPWSLEPVQALMRALVEAGHRQAVLYGEVYGKGVQSYDYGQRGLAFRAFDLMINGQYCDYPVFVTLCGQFGVERVPLAYKGGYSLEAIKTVADGPSMIGGAHGREGVVVRPFRERQDARIGRVVLKYIGDAYLFGKAAEQDTTDQ